MKLYVSHVNAWAPGAATKEEWQAVKNGTASILKEKISPKIDYTDPLFRRRFSQLTKMTIHVIHKALETCPEVKDMKIKFITFRGELEREFNLTKNLIQDHQILPAAFSLSVFNTPVAAATIALKLKAGYSVILPADYSFKDAFLTAASSVMCGDEKSVLFVYADENIPPEFEKNSDQDSIPLSFSFVLTSLPSTDTIEIDTDNIEDSAVEFIKSLI